MDFNRLTVKAQEAVQAAAERARSAGNPELTAVHLLLALSPSPTPSPTRCSRPRASTSRRCAAPPRTTSRLPRATGASSLPQPSLGFRTVLDRAEVEAKALTDEYVATEHLLLALARGARPGPRAAAGRRAPRRTNLLEALRERPRRPARDRPERRGPLRRALEVRGRPDRARRGRPRRPRDRPRRRDPPHRPGAVAAARRTTRC